MKSPVIALVGFLALVASPSFAQQGPDREIEQINEVIDGLHEAAGRADGDAYFSLFTDEARFIGTDGAERWSIEAFRAYAEPYFSRGLGWTYVPQERVVSLLPIECRCVASFDERLYNAAYGETRGSGVLVRTNGDWKIDQYVLSFAVPNEVARQVVAVIAAGANPAAPGVDD